MSFVSPSFSHNFLKRLNIWSIDSLPLHLILITGDHNLPICTGAGPRLDGNQPVSMDLSTPPLVPMGLGVPEGGSEGTGSRGSRRGDPPGITHVCTLEV